MFGRAGVGRIAAAIPGLVHGGSIELLRICCASGRSVRHVICTPTPNSVAHRVARRRAAHALLTRCAGCNASAAHVCTAASLQCRSACMCRPQRARRHHLRCQRVRIGGHQVQHGQAQRRDKLQQVRDGVVRARAAVA